MKRVYLAGPEVFMVEAREIGAAKRDICREHGLQGVFPLDADIDLSHMDPQAAGLTISQANETLIASCDILIANMTPFRGPSMDVGTAFEMGFMRALGRPVFGYTNVEANYVERVAAFNGGKLSPKPEGQFVDKDGLIVEDFGMTDNLMMVGAVLASDAEIVFGTSGELTSLVAFEECVKRAALGSHSSS